MISFQLNTLEILDLMAYLISLSFLGYATLSDLRSREVENWVWMFYGPLGIAVTFLKIIIEPHFFVVSLASIIIVSGIALLMFYLGLFGGADAKAFICLSVTNPLCPLWILPIFGCLQPIYPLSVLYNAYLLSSSVIIYNIVKNLKYRYRKGSIFDGFNDTSIKNKILAVLTGYKVEVSRLRNSFLYPMEKFQQDKRRFTIFFDAEVDRDERVNELRRDCTRYNVNEVWATPGLPLLGFVMISFILTSWVGDMLIKLIMSTLQNLLF